MNDLEKCVWGAVFGQVWELHRWNKPPWKKMPEVTDVVALQEMGHEDAIKQADQAVKDLRHFVEQNERLHCYGDLEMERRAEEKKAWEQGARRMEEALKPDRPMGKALGNAISEGIDKALIDGLYEEDE